MSSRNKAHKDSRYDSRDGSGKSSTISKRAKAHSTSPPSSRKAQTHSSSPTKHNTARAPSPRPSHTSSISTSTSNTSQSSTSENDMSTYTHTDLISMSAWTEDGGNAHHYQDFSYQHLDNTETVTCLYHGSMIEPRQSYGHGLPPLERWAYESIDDGGALALQLGYQLRLNECTCVGLQDDVTEGTE